MATREEVFLAILGAVASVLYFTVAKLQAQRGVQGDGRGALRGFIIFWAGLGVLGLVTLALTLGPDLATYGMAGVRIVLYLLFAVIYAMVGGLVYYMVYLYTGNAKTRWFVAAFYLAMMLFLVWLIEAHAPHIADNSPHVDAGEPTEVIFHLHEEPAAWAGAVLSLGLVVPPMLAIMAYALLFFRTNDRTSRYRIGMVSAGFFVWFLYSTLGSIARLITDTEQGYGSRLISQILGLIAATLTLLAYEPPRWIREKLRIREVRDTMDQWAIREPPRQ